MSLDASKLEVINNEIDKRFEVVVGDQVAFAEYMKAGNNLVFTHTEVPPEFEGQGVGNRLASFALNFAKENGFKVQALCPFINAYVRRHPEYHDITWGYGI